MHCFKVSVAGGEDSENAFKKDKMFNTWEHLLIEPKPVMCAILFRDICTPWLYSMTSMFSVMTRLNVTLGPLVSSFKKDRKYNSSF